jgi:hypothetical protein
MNVDVQQELNIELQKALKEAYRLHALPLSVRADRNIKLPSTLGIEREENGLLLRLKAKSVTTNMQTDAAAFEAWALVLRVWLGEKEVPHIVLDWEAPPNDHNGHYERFLYRVVQFRSLFPEWFRVAEPHKPEICRASTESLPLLNVAAGKASESLPKTTSREYKLELELIGSESFRRHFGLKLVDRQFPVGLFAGKVSGKTRIFTGGKSAIDIVGIDGDNSFYIFELKASDNISAGTISELLLYTALIREAAKTSPRISFDDVKPGTRACVHPDHVRQCTGIHAVMLVENMHPLLDRPELLNTLNNAAEAHWNSEAGAKPVCFSNARIGDFEKAPEASV